MPLQHVSDREVTPMIWLYAGLLVVALIVFLGTLGKRNTWAWVATYWWLLVLKCMVEFLREVLA